MPTVSVIMAAYNHGSYIPAAIESVLSQTIPDLELVVVDDGSTDSTPEAVRPYLSDPRVRYFRQQNQGQVVAKNCGIAQTKGEFIAFLDSDDVWLPRKLELQLPLFDDPRVGVVHARRELIDSQGRKRPHRQRELPRGEVLDHLFIDNFICFSSSVVRRSCLDELGAFDEQFRVGIDYELWLRIATRYLFDHADEPLVLYRTGHGQLSDFKEERLLSAFAIMGHSLRKPEIKAKLRPHTVRKAYAMTHTSAGYYQLNAGRTWQARSNFLTSLKYEPFQLPAYKLLLKSIMPEWVVRGWHFLNGRTTS